jgi:hypothetical protein
MSNSTNIETHQVNIDKLKDYHNEYLSNGSNNKSNINDHNYNKVIKVFMNEQNEKKMKLINEGNNNDLNKKEKDIYDSNLAGADKIKPLNELLLVKNTIGQESIEPINQDKFKANHSIKKISENMKENNLEELKEEEKENQVDKKIEKEINNNDTDKNKDMNNNKESENKNKEEKENEEGYKVKIEEGELDLTYNFDNDTFNVTNEQMGILDGDANRIYKKYKNEVQLKNFKENHPKLQHNIKLVNNNLEFFVSPMKHEEKQKKLSSIFGKQKLILEKIKRDNNQRNIITNNNDSINQTKIKINKSNKIIYRYKLNQLNNNSNGNFYINQNQSENKHVLSPYYNNNTISNDRSYLIHRIYPYNRNSQRYQNIFNKEVLLSDNRSNNSSEKNNLDYSIKRKYLFEPYTLNEYKQKYENGLSMKKLGGLGANIGGEDWRIRQKLLERKKQYSEYIKNDENFKNRQNRKKIQLKKENSEVSRTIISKKSSDSKERMTEPSKKINNKSEINADKGNQLKLPLIKQSSKINQNLNRKNEYYDKNRVYKGKQNYEFMGMIPKFENNKDLNQLIQQYEEYNGKI